MHFWDTLCFFLFLGIAQASSECPLDWNSENGIINHSIPCPWGTRLDGDVTLPNDPSFFDWICVVYGYIPFAVVGLGIFELIFTGPLTLRLWRRRPERHRLFEFRALGTRESSFIIFCGIVVFFNEVVFKNIWKFPRPSKSCDYTCGFPSSHASMATGFYTLMFFDGVFRVFTKTPLTVEEAECEARRLQAHSRTLSDPQRQPSFRPTVRAGLPRLLSIVPLSATDVMSQYEMAVFVLIWSIMLLPVPLSRVALNDHTPGQVCMGAFIGCVEAAIWFKTVRWLQGRYNKQLGANILRIFRHNYALPRFQVRSDCVRLLVKCNDEETVRSCRTALEETYFEIEWYAKLTTTRESRIVIAAQSGPLVSRGLASEYNFLFIESYGLRELQHRILEKLKQIGVILDSSSGMFRYARDEELTSLSSVVQPFQRDTCNMATQTDTSGWMQVRACSDPGPSMLRPTV